MPQTLVPAEGVTATHLLGTRRRCASDITPAMLEAWLVGRRLATLDEHGHLTATALGLELGSALAR